MEKIIKYFIERKLLVNLIVFFIISVGLFNLVTLKREGYPIVDQGMMRITTVYPGATPEDVELNVTEPIEDAIKTVEGVEKWTSVSYENYSSIWVYIDLDIKDMEKVKNDIRRAVDSAQLPREVEDRPYIWEWKVSSFGILEIGVYSRTLPEKEVKRVTRNLKKRIETLPSVANVHENGVRDMEICVKIDLEKINEKEISFEEIINAVKGHNIQITAGALKSKDSEKIIVTCSKFKSIEEIGDVVVRSNFEGKKILLKDIAEIVPEFEEKTTTIFRFNGMKGMALVPVKKESADVIKAVREVKKCVQEFKDSIGNMDIEFAFLFDLSEETAQRLDVAKINAIIGLILVLVTLFLFMNFNNALWTAMGIPFAFCFAVLFFPFFGVTINSVSLLGVIIVLGMVVDDAIIISENIDRHRIMGENYLIAGIKGTVEIVYPVLATVLTTIVAFLPILLIEGMVGDFGKEIPIVVTLVLLGSLFEAIVILPCHVTRSVLSRNKNAGERKFVLWLKEKYSFLVEKALNHHYIVIAVFILLMLFSFYLFKYKMKFQLFPDVDSTRFVLTGKMKEAKNLDWTSKNIEEVEKFILSKYDLENTIRSFMTEIGLKGRPDNFRMEFYLYPSTRRKVKCNEIIKILRAKMDSMGTFTRIFIEKDNGGPPVGRGLEITIAGNDERKREEITDDIVEYLSKINGVYDIDRSDRETRYETRIYPETEKIACLGLTPLNIANTLRASYDGVVISQFREEDENINIRIMLKDKYRSSKDTVSKVRVLNVYNRLVHIDNALKFNDEKVVTEIRRYNSDRATFIEADVNSDIITPSQIYTKLKNDFKNFENENPGFRLILGGEAEESNKSIMSIFKALWVAIAGIAFILLLQFKNLLYPFIIMLTIPFGFIGVILAFYIQNITLGIMALMGVVGLSGVVVNGAIVMISFINNTKKEKPDVPVVSVVKECSVNRLRPVLMTTITTVASIFPTAYGIGGYDVMIAPAGMALAWGLTFATLLTLFLVPCFYLVIEDFNLLFRKIFKDRDIKK